MSKPLIVLFAFLLPVSSAWGQSFRPRSSGAKSNQQSTERSLELRVLIDAKSAIGTSHEWMQALADVGADRVVAETSRVKTPSFEEFGEGRIKTLAVIGIVKQGMLHLPGGKFSIRQISAIRSHLKKLRDDGAEVTIAEKVAFGLTAKQLIGVHDQLSAKIATSTVGRDSATLSKSLIRGSGFPNSIDQAAESRLANSMAKVETELEGFTTGTALALTLRQMGLVFEPTRPQGESIRLLVRKANPKTKNWPVGWPVSEPPKKAAPELYVKIDIQATETPILDLLNAIEGRVGIPFFYDYANIASEGIDLSTTKVSFSRPGKKSSYDMVIDKVLNQCKPKLKSELRIDEIGKRFLWITPR